MLAPALSSQQTGNSSGSTSSRLLQHSAVHTITACVCGSKANTQAGVHAFTCTHTHTHTHTNTYTHVRTHTYTNMNTCQYTQARTHTYTCTCTRTTTQTHTHAHMYTRTNTNVRANTHRRAHTHTHAHAQMRRHACAHTYTCTKKNRHTRAQTQTHAHIHMHAHVARMMGFASFLASLATLPHFSSKARVVFSAYKIRSHIKPSLPCTQILSFFNCVCTNVQLYICSLHLSLSTICLEQSKPLPIG